MYISNSLITNFYLRIKLSKLFEKIETYFHLKNIEFWFMNCNIDLFIKNVAAFSSWKKRWCMCVIFNKSWILSVASKSSSSPKCKSGKGGKGAIIPVQWSRKWRIPMGSSINHVDIKGGLAKCPYYHISIIKENSPRRGRGSKMSKNFMVYGWPQSVPPLGIPLQQKHTCGLEKILLKKREIPNWSSLNLNKISQFFF